MPSRLNRIEKPEHLDKAIISYVKYLRRTKNDPINQFRTDFSYIVFGHGSVVRLSCDTFDELPLFLGFQDEEVIQQFTEQFPHHNLTSKSPTFHQILTENVCDWNWSQTLPTELSIAKAYDILMKDGYPKLGESSSSRSMIFPLDNTYETVLCVFNNDTNDIATLCCIPKALDKVKQSIPNLDTQRCLNAVISAHQLLGTEQRKYDYMFPQPYAHISSSKNGNKVTFF